MLKTNGQFVTKIFMGSSFNEIVSKSKKYFKEGDRYKVKTIEEILYKKSKIAFKEFKKINKNKNKTFVVAGGVAANLKIREVLTYLMT